MEQHTQVIPASRGPLAKLRDGTPLLRFTPEEMHTRLVEYTNEEFDYDPEKEWPVLEIVDDSVIEVDGRRIGLTGLRTFILNCLRLNQGYPQTRAEIVDLGFQGAASSFISGIRGLIDSLHQLGDQRFIEQERLNDKGRSATYMLLPEVHIIDRRNSVDNSPRQRLLNECGAIDENGQVKVLENGCIDFAAPRTRAQVTLAMIDEFRDIAKVDSAIAQIFENRMGRRGTDEPILPLKCYPPMTPAEETFLLGQKEQGLHTYLSALAAAKEFSEADVERIIAGTNACFELFARNMDIVQMLARTMMRSRVPFYELYQEGAMQLMEAVVRHDYNNTGLCNFRYIATRSIKHLKGRGIYPLYSSLLRPVGTPREQREDYIKMSETIEALQEELGYTPSAAVVGQRMGVGTDKVLGIMALGMETSWLDANNTEDDQGFVPYVLHEDDFTETVHDHMEKQAAVDSILGGTALTDTEKIVISLYYQIFYPALKTAKIMKGGNVVFNYPESEEDFNRLTAKSYDLTRFSTEVLGCSKNFARTHHNRALRKARVLLEADPSFDAYGRNDTPHARLMAAAEDEERERIISCALDLSPDKRLGSKEIEAFYKAGALPLSESQIHDLFGSLPDFQRACGFEPNKLLTNRSITAQEIIDLALELKPDGPLSTGEVKELSKRGSFVSYAAIKKHFNSLPEFHLACGFKIEKAQANKLMSDEEIIQRALGLSPDGPLSQEEIKKLSKQGDFVGMQTIRRRFDNLVNFQRACGFDK